VRAIEDQIDRAKLRFTLTYALTRRFSAGIEWNPLAETASPLANWHAVTETRRRPALILGTSSDRIGTPSGQSFYATLSKDLGGVGSVRIAPYAGVAYGTYEDLARAIGGLNVDVGRGLSTLALFDGDHGHGLVTWSGERFGASLVLVRFKDIGVSLNLRF